MGGHPRERGFVNNHGAKLMERPPMLVATLRFLNRDPVTDARQIFPTRLAMRWFSFAAKHCAWRQRRLADGMPFCCNRWRSLA